MSSPLSDTEKLELLNAINIIFCEQESYINLIYDSCLLAVNQVQDKRIEFLEKGPEVTTQDIIISVFLSVCISSSVAGKVIQKLGSEIFTRIGKSRHVFLKLSDYGLTTKDANYARHLNELNKLFAGRPASPELAKTLVNRWGVTGVYDQIVFDIAKHGLDVFTKTFEETSKAILYKKSNYPSIESTDTGGVSILNTIQEFKRSQNYVNNLYYNRLRDRILTNPVLRFELKYFKENMKVFSSGINNGMMPSDMRNHFKLYFEACIWAMLIETKSFEKPAPMYKAPSWKASLAGGPAVNISDPIGVYLATRLKSPDTGKIFAEDATKRDPVALQNAIYLVYRHLVKLRSKIVSTMKGDGGNNYIYKAVNAKLKK